MSRDAELADRLARHVAFAALDHGQREELIRGGARRSLGQGEHLVRDGASSDRVYMILSGAFYVERVNDDGERYRFRRVAAPELVGFSMVAGAPASASVVAAEDSQVFSIRGDQLRALYASRPDSALAVVRHMASVIAQLTGELEESSRGSVSARVHRRLAQLAAGQREVVITHDALASQVGAERASVSRALASLEGDGLIRRHRGRIELL